VKVIVCDDHELYREGIKQLLCNLCSVTEVIETDSLDGLLALKPCHDVNLLLLDLSMPGSMGILSLNTVLACHDVPVAIISANDSYDVIQQSIQLGAVGFLPKSMAAKEMAEHINILLSGEQSFPKNHRYHQNHQLLERLSTRQKEMSICLIDGLSNKEIAVKLCLSEGTVKQYMSELLRLFGVENRTQAAMKAKAVFGIANTGS